MLLLQPQAVVGGGGTCRKPVQPALQEMAVWGPIHLRACLSQSQRSWGQGCGWAVAGLTQKSHIALFTSYTDVLKMTLMWPFEEHGSYPGIL